MSALPPLPGGFVLDQQPQASAAPPLPAGFVLDQPAGGIGATFSDVPKEIAGAFTENLDAAKKGTVGAVQSEAARLADPNMSLLDQFKGRMADFGDVGKAALAVPGMLASPITGAARSLIGHPYSALTGIPYEQSKEAVDTAMMGLAPKGGSPVGTRTLPAKTPTAPELRQSAVDVFQSPEIKNTQIPPSDVANLSAQIENELVTRGFRPSAGSAQGTFSEVKKLSPPEPAPVSPLEQLQAEMNNQPVPTKTPPIQSVTVDDLRSSRRALNITAKQRDHMNQPTPDAVAAQHAIGRIDDLLDTVAPEIRAANADYAASKRANLLDYRSMKAEHRAAKTGSGSNIENTMRQEVDKIGNRGLTPDEIAARDRIVEGSAARNALRKAGKLGVSDGLSLSLHAAMGWGSGGASLPIAAAGTIARKVGEVLTKREIAALSDALRSRSPLAQSRQPTPIPPPSPALAAVLPPQLQQILGLGLAPMNSIPAYADQNQQRRGR